MPFDSGSSNSKTTTSSSPWAPQVPYIMSGLNMAKSLLGQSTTTPTNPILAAGINQTYARGINGSPYDRTAGQTASNFANGNFMGTPGDNVLSQAANNPSLGPIQSYLEPTALGQMLNSNPYVDAMFGKAAGQVEAGTNSMASAAGRYGSNLHQNMLTQGLNDLATNIYGQNYANERQNQLAAAGQIQSGYENSAARQLAAAQALQSGALQGRSQQLQGASMLPGIANQDLTNLQAVTQAGQLGQNLAQANTLEPWDRLSRYIAGISGNYGGQTTSTQPYYTPSPFSQIAGAGLGAAGAYGMFG